MNENIKKIREIQLVAAALQQLEPELIVKQADSEIVDLFVELPVDNARFAIVTLPSRSFDSDEYNHLLIAIDEHINQLQGCPLYIAFYDEVQGLMIGSFVNWDFSESRIVKQPQLYLLTKDNIDRLFNAIRSQDHQIRLLRNNTMMVVKTIKLGIDRRGFKCNAEMAYLRDFTPWYKMNPKDVTDQRERMFRNWNGQPQDEYPHDFLDDNILEAVRQIYPDADVHNSLLITSTEYRMLLRYRNYQKDFAEFRFLPDISDIQIDMYPMLGKIEGAKFVIDILMPFRLDKNAFANEGFELRFPLDGWFETMSKIVKSINTMHRVTDVL